MVMKVVALKIYERQDMLLRALVEAGLYPSKSEALRTAAWDLLRVLLSSLEEGKDISVPSLPEELKSQFVGTTMPISAKFPLPMITLIDYVVSSSQKLNNRSAFFRKALVAFLATDSQMFSPYIFEDAS